MRKSMTTLYAVTTLWVLSVACVGAETYKWTDEQGQVHYSQSPPPGRPAQTIAPPPKVDTEAAIKALEEQKKRMEKGAKKVEKQAKKAAEKQQTEKHEADRKQACETWRQNLEKLRNVPVYKTTVEGGREYLTDDQRQAETESTERKVAEHCNP
ncbi:MAG: DUF4124 domain-containing protein [Gammaproteobacteria bacterium]